MAKSHIYISFNDWGLKHEKLSIIGIIIHFINVKYKVVARLISLLELPGHGKTSISK
jgi:hypothetical protein